MRPRRGRTSHQVSGMAFRLRDNLHWCISSGRVIFLDVEADRYFCLPSRAEAAFLRVAYGEIDPEAAEDLQPLIGRGLLIEDQLSSGIRPKQSVEPASGDLPLEAGRRPNAIELARAFASELAIGRLLRKRSFAQVLDGIVAHPAKGAAPVHVDATLRGIVSASVAISLVLRAADRCLVRAIAVHAACRRRGINPKLMFGVRMNPFGAHCWVQLGSTVLVGEFEQVRLYTPIMVLG